MTEKKIPEERNSEPIPQKHDPRVSAAWAITIGAILLTMSAFFASGLPIDINPKPTDALQPTGTTTLTEDQKNATVEAKSQSAIPLDTPTPTSTPTPNPKWTATPTVTPVPEPIPAILDPASDYLKNYILDRTAAVLQNGRRTECVATLISTTKSQSADSVTAATLCLANRIGEKLVAKTGLSIQTRDGHNLPIAAPPLTNLKEDSAVVVPVPGLSKIELPQAPMGSRLFLSRKDQFYYIIRGNNFSQFVSSGLIIDNDVNADGGPRATGLTIPRGQEDPYLGSGVFDGYDPLKTSGTITLRTNQDMQTKLQIFGWDPRGLNRDSTFVIIH